MRRPLVVAFGIVTIVLVGCRIPDNALDGPLAVPLRITADATSVEVDAPTWFAAQTAVYLCPDEPDQLPEPGPRRVGWRPATACHDFGRRPTADGLHANLALGDLGAGERPSFVAAATWYVLLVKVEGERATAAIHSSFTQPEGFE
jgi:hypothetical protein